MMKDDDFNWLRGFADEWTNGRTDICDCRVAFATEGGGVFGGRLASWMNCMMADRYDG